jgi:hypothetical protein
VLLLADGDHLILLVLKLDVEAIQAADFIFLFYQIRKVHWTKALVLELANLVF